MFPEFGSVWYFDDFESAFYDGVSKSKREMSATSAFFWACFTLEFIKQYSVS